MAKILKLVYGYLIILVQGEQLERFLNICKNKKIYMEKIRSRDEGQLTAQIEIRDFFRLKPVRNKTGVHIRIIQKRGMPFFFFRNKKRKAFFAGMILGSILIFFMTGRIWNIHIEGNVKNSTEKILEFLGSQDIVHGMAKGKINCSEIAAAVRRKFPEITWVSARIEGTRLLLDIREGIDEKEKNKDFYPCDLLADRDGIITDMIVRSGVPVKKVGEICKKGEVLVSGEIHIMNDSQEILRNEYVHADADIFISRKLSYYQEFPMKYQAEISDGKIKKRIFFRLGQWYFRLYGSLQQGQRCIAEETPLYITENFRLPVWIGCAKITDYTIEEKTYTQQQACREAMKRFRAYERKLLQERIKINENHITTKVTGQLCITKGVLFITEQTGKEKRIYEIKQK